MNTVITALEWLAGALTYLTLAVVSYGIWKGTRRPAGLSIGLATVHRSPWFYLVSILIFISISIAGWISLPLPVSEPTRNWLAIMGAVLFFPGMSFVLWGRLALGKNYFVSSGFGVQLFEGHQLVTTGPYAVIRHPMYTGLIAAAAGSLLLYLTWTTFLFAIFAPFTIIRAYKEEKALAQAFGSQWLDYCRRVPAFIPGWKKQ